MRASSPPTRRGSSPPYRRSAPARRWGASGRRKTAPQHGPPEGAARPPETPRWTAAPWDRRSGGAAGA
eukprot:4661387-Prymnesium_polylepis.2